MNTKAKGSRNEHRSMLLLEAAGCATTRAAAPLGAFDIGPTDILLVLTLRHNLTSGLRCRSRPAPDQLLAAGGQGKSRIDSISAEPGPVSGLDLLMESLANNHGFIDGNKRIAFAATN